MRVPAMFNRPPPPAAIRLRAIPVDPVPGDRAAGERLCAGRLFHAGHGAAAAEARFDDATAPLAWRDWANGFGWLRDLAAADPAGGARVAEPLVRRWLTQQQPDAAFAPGVSGRRLLFWTAHAPLILAADDPTLRAAVLNSIAAQARLLAHGGAAGSPFARLEAAAGLTSAGVLLDDAALRDAGERQFAAVLPLLIDARGGPLSRRPSDLLPIIELLALARAGYVATATPVAAPLASGLARAGQALALLRLGDGLLSAWHGGGPAMAARVTLGLRLAAAVPAGRAGGGFARLDAGATALILDAAPPPPSGHASTLAFELSDGERRLLTGCGAAPDGPLELRRGLASTAAHNAATVDDTNSTPVRDDATLGPGVRAVECVRRESEAGVWLDAAHDGYRRKLNVTQRRRLFVSPDGRDVRCEDTLEAAGRRAHLATLAVRLHLGPGIEPALTADGQGALLPVADGVWTLRTRAALAIERGIWIDGAGVAVPTRQLLLHATLSPGTGALVWGLQKR